MVYRPAQGAAAEKVMPLSGIPLKGAHNVENVLAAVCAARLAGRTGARDSRALSRASRPLSIGWSLWPRSTAWSFTTTQRPPTWMRRPRRLPRFQSGIHLILGGKDKGSDYTQLAQLLRARVRAVYTIGSAAAKIESRTARGGFDPLLRDAGQCGECGGRSRASGRGGAAGAGLLQLRPV